MHYFYLIILFSDIIYRSKNFNILLFVVSRFFKGNFGMDTVLQITNKTFLLKLFFILLCNENKCKQYIFSSTALLFLLS